MVLKNGEMLLLPAGSASKQFNGEDNSVVTLTNNNVIGYSINATYGLNVIFGNGTTAVTKDDYWLESSLENSITTNVISRSAYKNSGTYNYSDIPSLAFATVLVTNETADDITLTEIGLYFYSANSATAKRILLTRTVLTEPLVMESGKTYQITVAIN